MWERVRFPMGTDPVQYACAVAGDGLLGSKRKRPGRYSRFLTVAALLQLQVRTRPILLPVRKLAEHFPCRPMTIHAYTSWAREDGVLIRVKEHTFRSHGESRAAEYVFGLHFWKREMHRKLGELIRFPGRREDLAWIEAHFQAVKVSPD
jgi:hypothetical protein